ncbi:MAG: hypothetical protein LKF87_03705 [Clostridium tyrobutyricum]|jgi:hypothetical protein|uniref:hypothetical protein n=1 Tax=Clostridium tyrobutyricum TaxID=1519 RepID=UPI002431CE66|nr:hypothetical protein [Clostridium tyrobutyricum]MCH4199292.1 hypothetical protein [Clostridium tyrobutyricum]MCH4236624.1 hypothetical protein [Clostridium tyrobutyricum]MCH4258060.1 hypothetical protein [Clostridium tyrobutyricum]MCI1239099.1 hypothetical protein [Clostridium tyrobutyricum]MCI1651429.1 hypothetical protein [Clostridium tyrobutyricum]
MDDKTFLLNKLNLADAVLTNDADGVNTAITALNGEALIVNQTSSIKETILSFLDGGVSNMNIDLLKSVINQINGLNKAYLLSMVDLKTLSFRDSTAKTIVQEKLQDKEITFDDDNDKFNYYYILSNYAIVLRDRELIQAAITAVQAL